MKKLKLLFNGFIILSLLIVSVPGPLSAQTGIPAAPSNLRMNGPATASTIPLAWNVNSSTEDKFNIERKLTTSNNYSFLAQVGTGVTTYTDSGLPAGTSYDYRIQACLSGSGCSEYVYLIGVSTTSGGDSTSSTCSGLTLTFVDNKTTYAQGENVNYTWACTPGGTASSVTVQVVDSGGTATTYNSYTGSSGSMSLGFSTSNLAAGTYILRACFTTNCSPVTVYQNFTVTVPAGDTSPPSTPPAPALSNITSSQIVLTWPASTDNVGVTSYKVFRYLGGNTSGTLQATFTVTTTNLTETGLSSATSYTYTIEAYDTAGNHSPQGPAATAATFASETTSSTSGGGGTTTTTNTTTSTSTTTSTTSTTTSTTSTTTSTTSTTTTTPPPTTTAPPAVQGWGVSVDSGGIATIGISFNQEINTTTYTDLNVFVQKTTDPAEASFHVAVDIRGEPFGVQLSTKNPLITGVEYMSVIRNVRSTAGFTAPDFTCKFVTPTPGSVLTSCGQISSTVPPQAPVPPPTLQEAATANTYLTGAVIDASGNAVPYVGVHVFSEGYALNFGGPSGPDGIYKIPLRAGSYFVEIFPPFERKDLLKTPPMPFTIADGETKTFNLKFAGANQASKVIVGTLTFSNGTPVTDARVGAYNIRTGQWFDTSTNATGGYRIQTWFGKYKVSALAQNPATATWNGPLAFQEVEFNESNESETKTVNFTVPVSGSEIVVTAIDNTGLPVRDAGVQLESFSSINPFETGPRIPPQFKKTGLDGKVLFFVTPGNYYVRAFTPPESGFLNPDEQAVTVGGGRTSVTLQFRKKDVNTVFNLNGVVKFEDGTPVPQATVWGWSERGGFARTVSGSKGEFTLSAALGAKWHLGAGQEIGNIPFRSAEVVLEVTSSTGQVEIIVAKLNIELPPPVTVTQTATQPVVAASKDGAQIVIPAGSVASGGSVKVDWIPTVEAPSQENARIIGTAYDLTIKTQTGEDVKSLEKEIEITLPYNKEELQKQGISEDALNPSYFDESTGAWVKVNNYTIDKENQVVVLRVNHLTRFALVAPADVTAPTSPTSLSSRLTGVKEVTLSWANPKADFHHVKVYRSELATALGTLLDDLVTTETYKDASVATGKTYYYSLKSVDAAGNESEIKSLKVIVTGQVQAGAVKAKFTVSLKRGSRGAIVKALQQLLIDLGYLSKTMTPTEYFGPLTEKAVKEFQKAKGFERVGSLGPKTRAELNKLVK